MKKLLSLLTLFLLGIVLVSCSSIEESKIKEPVVSLLDGIKTMKFSSENLPVCIENYTDQLAPITGFTDSTEPNKDEIYNFFFGHLSYKISNVKKIDENTYSVLSSIRNIGSNSFNERYAEEVSMKALQEVFSKVDANNTKSFNEADQIKLIEEYNQEVVNLMKNFKFKDSDFLSTEYTFTVKKDENSDDFKIVLNTPDSINDFYMALNPSEPTEEIYFDENGSSNGAMVLDESGNFVSVDELIMSDYQS